MDFTGITTELGTLATALVGAGTAAAVAAMAPKAIKIGAGWVVSVFRSVAR